MEGQLWPAVGWEDRPWTNVHDVYASRTQLRRHRGPYRAALVPTIANEDVDLPGGVLAESAEAAAEIARFDASVSSAFGDGDGERGSELGPLAVILLRSESASSSQIENLTVGARQLALAELGEHTTRNARLVAANVVAMQTALARSGELDSESILAMHAALLGDDSPDMAGVWRSEQVWIGGGTVGPHHADFIPPHHERVPAAIDDLALFIDRDDVPVLVQAAIAHAQFETVHPFPDGNGRTGRALIHAMLKAKGLTRRMTVPVSAGLLHDVDRYFDALDAYRRGDPVPIVEALAQAAHTSIGNGRRLLEDVADIRSRWRTQITARRDAAAWKVSDLLIRHPVISARAAADDLGISTVAAQGAIDHLVEVGVLRSMGNRQRNRTWQSTEILTVLDSFAARAGKRRRH